MKDKELQLEILEKLMGEMDDYEFEKKLKPKMMTIKVEKSTEDRPSSLRELIGGKEEELKEDMPSEEELALMEKDEEEEEDSLGARFKKHFKK